MSFFIEISKDEKTVILFSTGEDIDKYKVFLSNMGGTFFRELETLKGGKYPAWIFDINKKLEVEAFVAENDENESVHSLPDIESIIDEIFRRIENLEKAVENLYQDNPKDT